MDRKQLYNLLVVIILLCSSLSLIVFSPSVEAVGSTYYVSTTGSDITGDGSLGTPWRTIYNAANHTVAGDMVYVLGGTYQEEVIIHQNGTGSNWITYSNYLGQKVVIDGKNNPSADFNANIVIRYASYIRITGFNISNSTRAGVHVYYWANHIRVDNCTVWNSSQRGFAAFKSGGTFMQNITVDNCTFIWNNNNWMGNAGGETLDTGANNFCFKYNTIIRSGRECIDLKSSASNGTVHHNRINTSGKVGDYGWSYNHIGIYMDDCDNVSVFCNRIWGNNGAMMQISPEVAGEINNNINIFDNVLGGYNNTNGSCNGIAMTEDTLKRNINIYQNTIYVQGFGFSAAGCEKQWLSNIKVYNNIFCQPSASYYVFYLNGINSSFDGVISFSNNLVNEFGTGSAHNQFKDGDDKWTNFTTISREKDPLFVNRFIGDLQLNYTSYRCIDNASSVLVSLFDFEDNSRPQGVGYDIGAYEYTPDFSFSGVVPVNASTNSYRYPVCNVTINESHGWMFNYTLSENTTGSWVTQDYGYDQVNGSFSFSFVNASSGLTEYWWRVCAVNHSVWLNSTYHFTTGVLNPLVTTNDSTGVEETNATLRGYLVDDGGTVNISGLFENYTVGWDNGYNFYGTTWKAQTLIPTISHMITNVTLLLHRSGFPGLITVFISDTDGSGKPINNNLTWGTTDGDTLTSSTPGEWRNINFVSSYALIAGTQYAIIVKATSGTAGNRGVWKCDVSSPTYLDGTYVSTANSGSTWTIDAGKDFMFKEWGYYEGAVVNFEYGTTTAYGINATPQIKKSNETFDSNITGLSPGTLYHYRAMANNSNGTGYGTDMTLLTKPLEPSGLTVSTVHNTSMTLSWTKGSGANNTMIRQSTVNYPASITDGDLVYNGTLSACTNISLTPGVLYYFSAWSYTAWSGLYQWSDTNDTVCDVTRPNPPTNALITLTSSTTATLSWVKGAGANNTVVVYKATGMPTSVTDGTVTYNNTGTSYSQTITAGNVYFFKAWSYVINSTYHHYSDYGTEFLNISGGGLMINCFDDDNGSNLTFDVTIVSYNGDPPTYTNTSCTNTHIVNVSRCPIGPGSTIKVSAANHNFRTMVIDVEPGIYALLNFYLPYTSTPMPDNESYLYKFTVNNEIGQPVENAYMEIKKQINMSNFSVIYTIYTDASGNVYPWLTPGQIYIVFINKTGYQDQYSNFIPTDQVFTQTFILKANSITPQPPIISAEEIHFTVELSDSNTSMWANYTDDSGFTEWTTLVISCFNYSTFTWSTIGWDNTTNMSAWDTITTGRNSSNDYYFNLTYHNTYLGTVHMQIVIEADKHPPITPDEANDRFSWMGVIPFGATNFLMWLFFIAICYYADERDAGKFIIVFGVICIFLSSWVGFISENALTIGGGIGLGILFIIIGFIMERGGKK